jgi:signal transduction histidine kinase
VKALRTRLIASILMLVLVTVVGSWLAMGAALRPLLRQVFTSDLRMAVTVVERLAQGADHKELERRWGVRIRQAPWYNGDLHPSPPESMGRRGTGRRGSIVLETSNLDGYELHASERGNLVFVNSKDGWLMVRREVERPEPKLRVLPFLALVALGVVGAAAALATAVIRPLERSQEAMSLLAAGDLSHRLPEKGPRELQQVARTFNAMAQQIQQRLQAEKQLLAGVSHELRTPMTRLRLELEMLRELGPDPTRLDRMEADIGELDSLISELTRLSRLELGQQPLVLEGVDLDALCTELAESYPRCQVQGSAGSHMVDRALLHRAVDNLLRNAARYAPEGPIVLALSTGLIQVQDRGPGVPAEVVDQLFEPFFRAEDSRNRHTGGLGLGLMIVAQVARLHGGRAWAELREGGGLQVSISLGQARVDPAV